VRSLATTADAVSECAVGIALEKAAGLPNAIRWRLDVLMTPLSAAVVLLLAGVANGSGRPCPTSRPDARVHVSFLTDSDLGSLAKWAEEATCIEYSFEPALASRRLGQSVILTVAGRDAGTIFEILLHSMNLRTYGHGAKRSIVADGPETADSRQANAKAKAELERDKLLANLDGEIKRKDESHYTISRRGADAVLGNMPSLARSLRVVPEAKDGKAIGFRLFGLKPDAPLAHLGFQNGDLVRSLNGNELVSPDKALAAYNQFRTTGVMRAGLVRRGLPLSVEVRIE
jgi:hypothetical protein